MLDVYSIFTSIQGESSLAGLPCTFIRLAGCPFNCRYCDTLGAKKPAGRQMTISRIVQKVKEARVNFVEVTGGEPLCQSEVNRLLSTLCDLGFFVALETSGAVSIAGVDDRVRVIMDVKCPDSFSSTGTQAVFERDNLDLLKRSNVELKFVVSSRADFDWALDFCKDGRVKKAVHRIVSPVKGKVELDSLAQWILESSSDFRLGVQLHKIIWPNEEGER